jgi:chemotaxis protein histidine kinase CheA
MSNQPLENVESNVLMEVLAPPLSKVESKVVSKLEKVLEVLGKKYNFEVEEALRYLNEEKSKKSEKSKNSKDLSGPLVKADSKYPLPFNGEKKEGYCNGVVKNHGLYTQCPKKVKEGYCKGCEDKPYGTIDDRLKVDLYDYKDPKGNGPKRYTEVLKKLKISKENVEEEAKRLNITINPIHFEEVVLENVKRGRPKSEKKVKEATGKKGRPKKEKKQVEVTNAEEEEDLFATLIANAHHQPLEKVEPNEDQPLVQPLEKVEPNEDQPLVQPLEKVEPNEEAKEESKDLVVPVAVEKVEKKAKKVKEADPAKEAEKLKKAEEKAAKDAAKEIEKQKKAEEKAAKEAEKQKKAEEKAAKEANKKKSKDLAPPLEKVEEEEAADVVRKFEHQGKSYYKSNKSGVIYNMEQEVVGKWNAERNDIDFEEEEEEEEYDD